MRVDRWIDRGYDRAEEDACACGSVVLFVEWVRCNCWALSRNMTPTLLIINVASFFSFLLFEIIPISEFLLKSLVFGTVIKSQK